MKLTPGKVLLFVFLAYSACWFCVELHWELSRDGVGRFFTNKTESELGAERALGASEDP